MSPSLQLYKEIKDSFEQSRYITLIDNIKYRNILSKLRMSSHKLAIETGRHNNIPRSDRKCILCDLNDIEDEYHFILVCTKYIDLRKSYIPRYYYVNPSMFKFIDLLKSERKSLLIKVAIYCDKAFKIRDSSI